jgi:hypothetical protein
VGEIVEYTMNEERRRSVKKLHMEITYDARVRIGDEAYCCTGDYSFENDCLKITRGQFIDLIPMKNVVKIVIDTKPDWKE